MLLVRSQQSTLAAFQYDEKRHFSVSGSGAEYPDLPCRLPERASRCPGRGYLRILTLIDGFAKKRIANNGLTSHQKV
jgi:hypothetical protein